MTEYRVVWEIDIAADSPREAAVKAREYQMPGTEALVFEVFPSDGVEHITVDLMYDGRKNEHN